MDKKIKIRFNVLAIVCIVLFCIAISPIGLQNDTFYTIKIGEHILENGIDMQDPFSYHQIPYTYPHWLYDLGIYLIYSAGGMLGIYLSTVVLSCILGITVYYTNKKIVKNDLISFVLTIGVMCVLRSFVAARAQLVTFILFALAIYFMESFLANKKKRYLLGLVIIPIIIANVHLAVWPFYFIVFLPYIAEYVIVVIADNKFMYYLSSKRLEMKLNRKKKKQVTSEKIIDLQNKLAILQEKKKNVVELSKKRRENPYKIKIERNDATKWIIMVFILCLLTGLFTPLGDTPYTYLVKTMQGNTTQNINEHLPMVLIDSQYTLVILIIVLALLIFTDTKIRLKDLFMLGGLTILALMSKRQLSLLALLGVYSVNRLICEFINKYDKQGTAQMMKLIATRLGQVITILIVILFSLIVYRKQAGDKFINTNAYPVEAAKYINENLNVNEIRLYNEYNYGSYLLYQNIPVFIDSRADLYTPEFNGDKDKDVFTDFINTAAINVHYEQTFKKYEITHLLIPRNAKINLFISKDPNYRELYKDDNFVIYERLTK